MAASPPGDRAVEEAMGSIVRLICTSPGNSDEPMKECRFDVPAVEASNIRRRLENAGWSVKVIELK
jgi:hypothetical protein